MSTTQPDLAAGFDAGSPASPALEPDDARVAATLQNWKRKLLDVSKRNRALNFKPNKVTTLAIVDEQPAEAFRQLYLREKAMRFRPAPPKPDASTATAVGDVIAQAPWPADATVPPPLPAAAADGDALVEVEEAGPSLDFVPYEAGGLDARHTDDVLQTTADPGALDKSLRRIDEQARVSLEEQGVNTLFLALGMLHYREAPEAKEKTFLRAPLVLLPVALSRGNARAGYTLRAAEDDPIVNPALAEYLKRTHGVTLPELPDLTDLPETYDLQDFFRAVLAAVAEQEGWQVKTDVYLSFFSFQKFVMYRDLEANAPALGAHRLVRQVVLRSGGEIRSLPDEVRAAELDTEFPPEATAQVVDADSTQLRAILAVSRGHDLVLEGPPGTGKSQTITNLIAQALAEDKSVLFVAEKMAALEVVHSRLVQAGLGEFCLELHSTKANKRAVMKEIAAALDASLQRSKPCDSSAPRLSTVRAELTAYAQAVHAPHGALAVSPFRAYGELEGVLAAPKVKFTRPIAGVTREMLEGAERDLRDLAAAVRGVGVPAEHPWRDTTRALYTEHDLDTARDMLGGLRARLSAVMELAARVEAEVSLPPVRTAAEVRVAVAVGEVLARSPGAPLAVLHSEAWNSPPPRALDFVERGRKLAELRERVESRFNADALEQDHAEDAAFMEAKETSPFRFLNFLSGRHRAVKRRWQGYRLPGYSDSLLDQAGEMRKVDALRRERAALAADDAQARELFGGLWQGERSDWEALDGYVRWVVEFRGLCVAHGLREQAIATAAQPRPDVSAVQALRDESAALERELAALRAHVGWPADHLAAAPLADVAARIGAMHDAVGLAPRWAAFESVRARVAAGLAAELLEPAMRGEAAFDDLAPALRRAFLQRWLGEVVGEREALRAFHTLTHEERVAEFRRLDRRVLEENRARLVAAVRDRVQARLREPAAAEGLPFLRRQLTLQRGLSPLRTTLQRSYATIRAIKPVFMMSPLTVAQLLEGKTGAFDLVVFDEASQLPAEDAVGAIGRGRQLVVVGDPKQLPPTNFFSVMSGVVAAPRDEDGVPLFEDSESILEEFMGSGSPRTRLRWHYRSAHESLISFSNVSFYDAELYTFPAVETAGNGAGLSFEHVADGVYEGKGLNLAEARRVADAVVRHAREHPDTSLGVGTFNLRQQLAIQDELEARRRADPALEPFFARDRDEPFFVKNLENIQGDERDVIFLSVTYAKDAGGVLRYNFGPLNGENGWRRLNVLTTRARQGMRVFSSMRGEEINPAHAASQGPRLLREFLVYAEHGRLEGGAAAPTGAEEGSPFEREVQAELARRGVVLHPQVGVAGYRIDFGVVDEEVPGRYVCGIECDGVAYHASESARDRDRLRQQVLEARGWTIHRLWSTDWFKDREGQVARLLELIERSREEARRRPPAGAEAGVAAAPTAPDALAESPAAVEAGAGRSDVEEEIETEAVPAGAQGEPYAFAPDGVVHEGDFNAAPAPLVGRAVEEIAAVEAPLHLADLAARVVARWGCERVGPRMMQRVREVAEALAKRGRIAVRGEFVYAAGGEEVPVRTRAGTRIPAERIAPEEFRAATLRVLRGGDGMDRKALVAGVRRLFGFSRTGPTLEAAIGAAIDALLAEEVLGEGSTGIRLRK
jgi:very-short-patch-repair endonuclease